MTKGGVFYVAPRGIFYVGTGGNFSMLAPEEVLYAGTRGGGVFSSKQRELYYTYVGLNSVCSLNISQVL